MTSFLFQYLVYLLDEGTIVKTDKILNYPKDWPSKPLLVFAKVQGLVRDNLELKNAAAKVSFLGVRLTMYVYLVFWNDSHANSSLFGSGLLRPDHSFA